MDLKDIKLLFLQTLGYTTECVKTPKILWLIFFPYGNVDKFENYKLS